MIWNNRERRNNRDYIERFVGTTLFLLITLAALLAPWIAPYPPGAMDITRRLAPPSAFHWLGTDLRGIDVWTSLLYGARVSLGISLISVIASHVIGTFLGLLAGFYHRFFGEILLRLMDVLLAFPGILLSLIMATLLPPSHLNLILVITATSWMGVTRLVRGEVLKLKEKDFVLAAYALGASSPFILRRHILPHIFPLLALHAALAISSVVMVESSLSFLGLGPQGAVPTWGQLLSEGKTVLVDSPVLALAPGLAIFWVVLAVNLLGNSQHERY